MKLEHRIDMKWKIKSEHFLNNNEVHGDFIETTIPGITYRLSIYCTNFAIGVLCVVRKPDKDPIEVDLSASIPSANKTFPLPPGFRDQYSSIIESRTEIMNEKNGYLVDGKLTIILRGTIKKQILKRKYPFEEASLGSIMWKKSKKDFSIVIGDRSIEVHKFLITERSGYFKAMFSAAWKEDQENKTETKFEYDVVEKAVKFCYDFPLKINSETEAKSLLEFSDYYDIKTLKHEVENWLTEKISAENVCDLANASIHLNSAVLRLCCINFLVKCLKDSVSVEGIDGLDADLAKQVLKHSFCTTQKSQIIRES